MSDVFISYASEDRPMAQALAGELQSRGLSVWWDRAIPPGRQFDEVIEEALDAARCVVLLWSPAAAASSWVKTEGAEAMQRGLLVPALIVPEVRIPLEFRRVQAADLSRWRAGMASPEFEQFLAAVQRVVATPGTMASGQARRGADALTRPPLHVTKATVSPPVNPPTAEPAPPAPPPTVAQPANKTWRWVAAGVAALVLVSWIYDTLDAGDMDLPPGALPAGPALPAGVAAQGLDLPLRWRDYALNFEGHLRWDGRSTLGALDVLARDASTGAVVSPQASYTALMIADAPGRAVFSLQVPVPLGDSRTPGAHTHAVNLVFEQQTGGGWRFARNCMAPGRPDLCFE